MLLKRDAMFNLCQPAAVVLVIIFINVRLGMWGFFYLVFRGVIVLVFFSVVVVGVLFMAFFLIW